MVSETKKWIAGKLLLYGMGFTMINEVTNPGVILGDRTSTYELNKVSFTPSNLIFEFNLSTYLKNCCQEHITTSTVKAIVPWSVFRSNTNFKFIEKDTLKAGKAFQPAGDLALIISSDGNQILTILGPTQIVHHNLNIDNGTIENTENSTEPEMTQKTNFVLLSINIAGEPDLKNRLLKAFGDLIKSNKFKSEAY